MEEKTFWEKSQSCLDLTFKAAKAAVLAEQASKQLKKRSGLGECKNNKLLLEGCTGSFYSLGQTHRLPEVCRVNRRHPSRPSSRAPRAMSHPAERPGARLILCLQRMSKSRRSKGFLSPPVSPFLSPISAFFHRFYDFARCSRTRGVLL